MMKLDEILKKAKQENKKIIIVLGDGIDPIIEMRGRHIAKVKNLQYSAQLKQLDAENWKYFEHVRNFTTNQLPIGTYFFIFILAYLDLIQAIITTNYDLTLDSIFSRLSHELKEKLNKPIIFNPILGDSERDDSEGYCNYKTTLDAIRVWKIHGSLSHIIFRNCKTLLRCPNFLLPFDPTPITERFLYRFSHDYFPERGLCCLNCDNKGLDKSICGHYVHAIDWNIPDFSDSNEIFKKIILAGMDEFRQGPLAVIILGFKGYFSRLSSPYNEEINSIANEVKNKINYWTMYVSPEQARKIKKSKPHAHLRDIVLSNNGVFGIGEPDVITGNLMDSLSSSGIITEKECATIYSIYEKKFLPFDHYERKRNRG